MRILVTGATGVIGRRIVPRLVEAGHDVTAAGRSPDRLAKLAASGARTLRLNLFDRASVAAAVAGRDVVINLATHIPSSALKMLLPWAWKENDRIRREGSALLVDCALAAGVRRFIQESFAPIYADGGDRWIDESWPQRPTKYNRTVLDAERSAARFAKGGGEAVVLRFAAFYGPDAWHLKDAVASVKRGRYPLPGDPEAYCSFVSHDDAASAVIAALELPAGVYNVCDDEPLTRREFARAIADVIGAPEPRPLPAMAARLLGATGELLSRSERMTNRKLRAAGWRPRDRSAREGLRRALGAANAAPPITADRPAAAARTAGSRHYDSSSTPPAYRSAPGP